MSDITKQSFGGKDVASHTQFQASEKAAQPNDQVKEGGFMSTVGKTMHEGMNGILDHTDVLDTDNVQKHRTALNAQSAEQAMDQAENMISHK